MDMVLTIMNHKCDSTEFVHQELGRGDLQHENATGKVQWYTSWLLLLLDSICVACVYNSFGHR